MTITMTIKIHKLLQLGVYLVAFARAMPVALLLLEFLRTGLVRTRNDKVPDNLDTTYKVPDNDRRYPYILLVPRNNQRTS
jgi:hypothetical protein